MERPSNWQQCEFWTPFWSGILKVEKDTHWSVPPSVAEERTSSRQPCATSPLLLHSSLFRWKLGPCRRTLRYPRRSPPSQAAGTPQIPSSPGSRPRVFPVLHRARCWRSPHHCAPWWWCRGRLPASSPPGRGWAGYQQRRSRWGPACYPGRAPERRRRRMMKPSHWATDLERTKTSS